MLIDFSTILFLLSMIAFLIWLLDAYLWQEKRDKENKAAIVAIGASEEMGTEVTEEQRQRMLKPENSIIEISKAFFPILVVVLSLRTFAFEPFRIPSPSMLPTLLPGDFILVSKSSYGFRLPVVNHRISMLTKPKAGDVVVFRFPFEPTTNYIKRLIGVPGDIIEFQNKNLVINGVALKYRFAGQYTDKGAGHDPNNERRLRKEMLGKAEHDELSTIRFKSSQREVYIQNRNLWLRNNPSESLVKNSDGSDKQFFMNESYPCLKNKPYKVKQGEYFVMGDNRDNSWDSRFWCGVPEKNLVGKAYAIWMNWDPVLKMRTERIFTKIK